MLFNSYRNSKVKVIAVAILSRSGLRRWSEDSRKDSGGSQTAVIVLCQVGYRDTNAMKVISIPQV